MTARIGERLGDGCRSMPQSFTGTDTLEASPDLAAGHQRARERLRRLTLGSVTALLSRVVHIGTMLLIVPLTLSHLGAERYGLWMTITSFLMLLTFADFGLGNGLLNAVASAAGRGDVDGARRAISTTFILLADIAVALIVLFGLVYPHIPWSRVLNASTLEMTREGASASLVLFMCVAIGLPFAITQRVQAGHEEVHRSNIWQAAGSLLALLGLSLAVAARGSLPVLVAAAAGAPVVAWIVATWYEFNRRRPQLKPSLRSFSTVEAGVLLRSGGHFVVLQLAAVLLGSADNLIVGQVLGPREVTTLAVPARLFAVVPILVGLALGPLWPAYAVAKAQGDIQWVRRTMVRSLVAAASVAALIGAALTVFGSFIIRAWVGDTVAVSTSLMAGLAVWTAMSAVGSAQAVALNGMGVLRIQAVCAAAATTLAVIAKIAMVRRFGVEGVVWSTVPIYLLVVLLPGAAAARHHLHAVSASCRGAKTV